MQAKKEELSRTHFVTGTCATPWDARSPFRSIKNAEQVAPNHFPTPPLPQKMMMIVNEQIKISGENWTPKSTVARPFKLGLPANQRRSYTLPSSRRHKADDKTTVVGATPKAGDCPQQAVANGKAPSRMTIPDFFLNFKQPNSTTDEPQSPMKSQQIISPHLKIHTTPGKPTDFYESQPLHLTVGSPASFDSLTLSPVSSLGDDDASNHHTNRRALSFTSSFKAPSVSGMSTVSPISGSIRGSAVFNYGYPDVMRQETPSN